MCEKNGVFDNADQGTVICDTSTISPLASKEFSVLAKDHKLVFCDTPMSGGIMGA
ncbi:MAG: NAD(P)-binding domain-containing protein [Flammeovirgaceae bacterium]